MVERVHRENRQFESGMLDVGDGTTLYWEMAGKRSGRPALYLHGGPGSDLGLGGYRRRYGPDRYLVVGLDQRGCGRSEPLVTDAPTTLPSNTTATLIDDIEAPRAHLGIESWLVSGVSWGTTLALAYARRLASGDPADRAVAAEEWDTWEATHVLLDPSRGPGPRHPDPVQRLVFATVVTHYWSRDAFMPGDRAILPRAPQLAGVPTVLIHGRYDVSGPAITPWLLHEAMPSSQLIVVEDEGHGGPVMMEHMRAAIAAFAAESAP
jgi:proline iminopeptidase